MKLGYSWVIGLPLLVVLMKWQCFVRFMDVGGSFPANASSRVVELWASYHLMPEPGTVEKFVWKIDDNLVIVVTFYIITQKHMVAPWN